MTRFIRWCLERFGSSRSQPSAGPEILSRLEQAKADFEAAVKLWPRDQDAIKQTWTRLRDLKCDQLREEIQR